MSEYNGALMLLNQLVEDDLVIDPEHLPPCGGGWQHAGAVQRAIVHIVMGKHIRLVRSLNTYSHDDGPGELEGTVIGASAHSNGRIALALDTGVAVDVTDPANWSWEVINA